MGYTHYYTKLKKAIHPKKQWEAFLTDVKTIACQFDHGTSNSAQFILDLPKPKIKIKIGGPMGEGDSAEFSDKRIAFNGVGPNDDHESFIIQRNDTPATVDLYNKESWEKEKRLFNFCKTARKPYDLLVIATLILYKHHFKDHVQIGSDGNREDLKDGFDLVNKTFKLKLSYEDIIN